MESIKTALLNELRATYTDFTLELIDADKSFSICIHQYPEYVIYIRPDDRETHFLCHYAHREDLERTADKRAEVQEWKQQAIFQLARSYQGGMKRYVAIACDYIHQAVQRMELYKEVSCRGFYKRVRTFEEAKLEQRWRPRRPDPVIPPPVCPRHNGVHWEAEKRKKKEERKQERKPDEVYVWKP
jgi:hypothetical protein